MTSNRAGPAELWHPRAVAFLGRVTAQAMSFKLYGLTAPGTRVSPEMRRQTDHILHTDVPVRANQMGACNNLGFAIIHPGTQGLTIAVQWWAQGSVLCQHIHRQRYDDPDPMDTISRPAVACVWELAIINAEQELWRSHMMQATPDPDGYLSATVPFHQV
jgi:hypothetical protein